MLVAQSDDLHASLEVTEVASSRYHASAGRRHEMKSGISVVAKPQPAISRQNDAPAGADLTAGKGRRVGQHGALSQCVCRQPGYRASEGRDTCRCDADVVQAVGIDSGWWRRFYRGHRRQLTTIEVVKRQASVMPCLLYTSPSPRDS